MHKGGRAAEGIQERPKQEVATCRDLQKAGCLTPKMAGMSRTQHDMHNPNLGGNHADGFKHHIKHKLTRILTLKRWGIYIQSYKTLT